MGTRRRACRECCSFAKIAWRRSLTNILVAPCVSPWGYEHVQRWSCAALDPNRGFHADTRVEECAALQRLIASVGGAERFLVHVDCHETTDTDESEFTPAKHARDGTVYIPEAIPGALFSAPRCVPKRRPLYRRKTLCNTHTPPPHK